MRVAEERRGAFDDVVAEQCSGTAVQRYSGLEQLSRITHTFKIPHALSIHNDQRALSRKSQCVHVPIHGAAIVSARAQQSKSPTVRHSWQRKLSPNADTLPALLLGLL